MHIMRKKFNSPLDATALGSQLRQARMDKDLSLIEVGQAVGVDHSQVSRYERGQMGSVGKNLHKICTFLQVDPDPARYSLPRTTLGRKIDELLDLAPAYEPAVAKLVEALEGLMAVADRASKPQTGNDLDRSENAAEP